MQDLSFDAHDPEFTIHGLRVSVQVFTFENRYGLDGEACELTDDGHTCTLRCQGLTWAGGQEKGPGTVHLRAVAAPHGTTFTLQVRAPTVIRCVKLVLKGQPDGVIVNLRETEERVIGPEGLILRYPDGWRGLYTPQVVIRDARGDLTSYRSLDTRVGAKYFALLRRDGQLDVELIYEGPATEPATTLSVPPWEVGQRQDRDQAIAEQAAFIARAHQLTPWEERPDVPPWAREIALVAAVHCQHYTGYIFNDYAQVARTMHWLAERIEPRRLLLYLPGWEGRYYWQYGAHRPDPRLGGEEGLERLMRQALQLGIHVMLMFGLNVVNKATENYEQWGAPAAFLSAGGHPASGSVDWDGSRHYDHGWNSLLNPGAPTWQGRLVTQIRALIDRYGFDAVFLDISAAWWNDPRHRVFDGVVDLVGRLRADHPDLLVAGEGWYDAMSRATPLVQSGHTSGHLHWHDQPYAPFFDTYNRGFAHLSLGDPGRGSTGVHELGYNRERRTPLRRGVIPTITIVEDTLATAQSQVEEIIADAHRYAQTYLARPA